MLDAVVVVVDAVVLVTERCRETAFGAGVKGAEVAGGKVVGSVVAAGGKVVGSGVAGGEVIGAAVVGEVMGDAVAVVDTAVDIGQIKSFMGPGSSASSCAIIWFTASSPQHTAQRSFQLSKHTGNVLPSSWKKVSSFS